MEIPVYKYIDDKIEPSISVGSSFSEVKTMIQSMEKNMNTRLDSMGKNMETMIKSVEKNVDTRIESMEKNMETKMSTLKTEVVSEVSSKVFKTFGAILTSGGGLIIVLAAVGVRASPVQIYFEKREPKTQGN